MSTEPAVIIGTITGGVTVALALLVAFGLELNEQQQDAILGAALFLAPLIAGLLIRRKVTPADWPRGMGVQGHDPSL